MTWYFNGKPCVHNHISPRYVRSRACIECTRLHDKKKYEEVKSSGKFQERLKRQTENRYKNYPAYSFMNIKRRAKDYGVECSITASDLNYPKNCECCGSEMEIGTKPNGYPTKNSPSVDRIDPSKGYTQENIGFLCYRCNVLKKDGSIEEFEKIISYMRNKHSMKNILRFKVVNLNVGKE